MNLKNYSRKLSVMGNENSGRKLLFDSPEELQKAVDSYFIQEDEPTLSGLAVHLGIGRRTLYEYKDRDVFSHIIRRAREKVESIYEARLIYKPNPTGVKFALMNMDWKEGQNVDMTTKGESMNSITKVEIVHTDCDHENSGE